MSPHVSVVTSGFVSVIALLTFLTVPLLAQDPTINSRRSWPATRDMRYREWILEDLEKRGRRSDEQRRMDWAQISEDFKRIQIVNNKIMSHKASNDPLNLKLIGEAVAEIYDRAVRLKSKLMLPERNKKGVSESMQSDLQISTMLSALSGLIRKFVKNPIFGEIDVLDAQSGMNACDDLERVIKVSKRIKTKLRSTR